MNKKLNRIRAEQVPGTFVKTPKKYDVKNEKVSFSFENFNTDSVKNERITYNSFFQNIESSKNAVNDFFKIIKALSRYKIGELMSNQQLKDSFHLNKIERDNHIERIESVLKNCYLYPVEKIEEFDRDYYEFQISDGKRVIWYKFDNIICPLFIDCNHMICIDSTRDGKMKMSYSIKSSFSHFSEIELKEEDKEIVEFIKIIINEYEKDKTISLEMVINMLKDMC